MATRHLSELEGRELLAAADIPWVDCVVADSAQAAVSAAEAMGFPVVLKGHHPDVLHKHSAGGLYTDVRDARDVADACARITESYETHGFTCEGFMVQPHVRPGQDLLVAVKRDRVFGVCLVIGAGGTDVESLNRTKSLRLADFARQSFADALSDVTGRTTAALSAGTGIDQLYDTSRSLLHYVVNHSQIDTIELNPVRLVTFPEPAVLALDVVVKYDDALPSAPASVPSSVDPARVAAAIRGALAPGRIGIVGVSRSKAGTGYKLLQNIKRGGYEGEIFVVHPSAGDEIHGVSTVATISEAAVRPVDVMFVCVAGAAVGDVVQQMSGNPIGLAVLVSPASADELVGDVTIVGPNTAGILSQPASLRALFQGSATLPIRSDGNVGLVSQSGSVASHLLGRASEEGVGLRYLVPTGNEVGVRMDDVIRVYAVDDSVDVIGLFIEGVADGDGLLDAIGQCTSAGKHVVAYPVGRTEAGKVAARSHTEAVAGGFNVLVDALKRAGAEVALEIEEFFDLVKLHSLFAEHGHDSLGSFAMGPFVVASSGASATIVSDILAGYGIDLPELPHGLADELTAMLPKEVSVGNPMDLTGDVVNNPELVTGVVDAFHRHTSGGLVVALGTQAGESAVAVARSISELWSRGTIPLVLSRLGVDSITPMVAETYRNHGVPVFATPNRVAHLIGRIRTQGEMLSDATAP